jgi:hypothetical protein
MQWYFPTGVLAWSPHPAPLSDVFPTASSTGNTALEVVPYAPVGPSPRPWPTRPAGGWPLPAADARWTPGTWPPVAWGTNVPVQIAPCLIPNPVNLNLPQIIWDISQNPVRAQLITGAHTIVSLGAQFSDQAIIPATQEVHVAVPSNFVQRLWGSIEIKTKSSKVTIWELLL